MSTNSRIQSLQTTQNGFGSTKKSTKGKVVKQPYSKIYKEFCVAQSLKINNSIMHALKSPQFAFNVDLLNEQDILALKPVIQKCQFQGFSLFGSRQVSPLKKQNGKIIAKSHSTSTRGRNTSSQKQPPQPGQHGYSGLTPNGGGSGKLVSPTSSSLSSNTHNLKHQLLNQDNDSSKQFKRLFSSTPEFTLLIKGISFNLKTYSRTLKVQLHQIKFNQAQLQFLSQGLAACQSIKELSITQCWLSDLDFEVLSKGISENESLISLDLSQNRLDRNAGRIAGKILSNNCRRRDEYIWLLGLRGEKPNEDISLQGICEINLANNHINFSSARDLCNSLVFDTWTRSINLKGNTINAEGIQQFDRLLDTNQTLISVDLRDNPGFTAKSSQQIFQKLVRNVLIYKENLSNMLNERGEPVYNQQGAEQQGEYPDDEEEKGQYDNNHNQQPNYYEGEEYEDNYNQNGEVHPDQYRNHPNHYQNYQNNPNFKNNHPNKNYPHPAEEQDMNGDGGEQYPEEVVYENYADQMNYKPINNQQNKSGANGGYPPHQGEEEYDDNNGGQEEEQDPNQNGMNFHQPQLQNIPEVNMEEDDEDNKELDENLNTKMNHEGEDGEDDIELQSDDQIQIAYVCQKLYEDDNIREFLNPECGGCIELESRLLQSEFNAVSKEIQNAQLQGYLQEIAQNPELLLPQQQAGQGQEGEESHRSNENGVAGNKQKKNQRSQGKNNKFNNNNEIQASNSEEMLDRIEFLMNELTELMDQVDILQTSNQNFTHQISNATFVSNPNHKQDSQNNTFSNQAFLSNNTSTQVDSIKLGVDNNNHSNNINGGQDKFANYSLKKPIDNQNPLIQQQQQQYPGINQSERQKALAAQIQKQNLHHQIQQQNFQQQEQEMDENFNDGEQYQDNEDDEEGQIDEEQLKQQIQQQERLAFIRNVQKQNPPIGQDPRLQGENINNNSKNNNNMYKNDNSHHVQDEQDQEQDPDQDQEDNEDQEGEEYEYTQQEYNRLVMEEIQKQQQQQLLLQQQQNEQRLKPSNQNNNNINPLNSNHLNSDQLTQKLQYEQNKQILQNQLGQEEEQQEQQEEEDEQEMENYDQDQEEAARFENNKQNHLSQEEEAARLAYEKQMLQKQQGAGNKPQNNRENEADLQDQEEQEEEQEELDEEFIIQAFQDYDEEEQMKQYLEGYDGELEEEDEMMIRQMLRQKHLQEYKKRYIAAHQNGEFEEEEDGEEGQEPEQYTEEQLKMIRSEHEEYQKRIRAMQQQGNAGGKPNNNINQQNIPNQGNNFDENYQYEEEDGDNYEDDEEEEEQYARGQNNQGNKSF